MYCSDIIREASAYSQWKQKQRPTLDNAQRVRDLGIPNPKENVLIKMLSSEIRELWERRGRKTEIRDRGDGRKQCLPDMSSQRLWQLAQGLHRIKPDGVQC